MKRQQTETKLLKFRSIPVHGSHFPEHARSRIDPFHFPEHTRSLERSIVPLQLEDHQTKQRQNGRKTSKYE